MFRRKDNGLWQEVLRELNGKRLEKPKYFYGKTQAEVKKKINEYAGEMARGELFSVIADKWDTAHREAVSYNGHRAYSVPYQEAVSEFGTMPISQITATDIDAFIKRIASKGFAKRTVKGYLSLLNMVFDYAILNGYCDHNPASVVSVPARLPVLHRELPDATNIQKIKESVDAPFGLFAYFLLYTGCRRGEALALKYEDINYDEKTITINKSLYWQGNKPYIKSTKTKAGDRVIILLDALAAKLPEGSAGYVFGGEKAMTNTMFRRAWDRYKKATQIDFTPHQLRHLFATILYECDIDEKMAQELLGHSSIKITRDIYTHIRRQRLSSAAAILNEKIII